jgi:hypothetical protein
MGVTADSFRLNATSFLANGTSSIRFVVPGSVINDNAFNGFVYKTVDLTGMSGTDSTDVELIPNSLNYASGSSFQKFELYLSDAMPLTIGLDSTELHVSDTVNGEVGLVANYILNAGDGVLLIDAVTDNKTWVTQVAGGAGGNTPLLVTHAVSMAGTAGTDTATVTVTASTADNTPQTYIIIRTLTTPAVVAPAGATEKRTGYRRD